MGTSVNGTNFVNQKNYTVAGTSSFPSSTSSNANPAGPSQLNMSDSPIDSTSSFSNNVVPLKGLTPPKSNQVSKLTDDQFRKLPSEGAKFAYVKNQMKSKGCDDVVQD